MKTNVIIAGFGGQGVLTLGKLICLAADSAGKNATFFPSYGGEQRGGTCNCTVVISDEEIGTPIVDKADYIIVMNEPSYDKFKSRVAPGGTLVVNESQIYKSEDLEGIKRVVVKSDDIATELGNRLASNMVMLGAFTGLTEFVDVDSVEEAIRVALGSKKQYLETNLKAFNKGLRQ